MAGPRVHIETERLLLREWSAADAEPFATLNGDPRVMEFFPKALTRAESDALVDGLQADIVANGFGLYATEEKATGAFLGFVGLTHPGFAAPFMPAVEIGWRLKREAWGNGYASEAARGCLAHAFGPLGLAEVVSFTATWNRPSQRVMERIGMTRDPAGDFDHPKIAAGHKLRRHVLYRISRDDYLSQQAAG